VEFSDFARACDEIEKESSNLAMTEMVSRLLSPLCGDELDIVTHLVMGQVFAEWTGKELGVGPSILYEILAKTGGKTTDSVKCLLRDTGDIGTVAERIMEGKRQRSLFPSRLDVMEVHRKLDSISNMTGKGSQERKIKTLLGIFGDCSPLEARYLARLILGEFRTGVGEGIVRNAIALAFNCDAKLVERAYMLSNDLGEVAGIAAEYGGNTLRDVSMRLYRPVNVMRAQLAKSLEKTIDEMGAVAVEWKYDGTRIQVHHGIEGVRLWSRRLEDVTDALPEIVKMCESALKGIETVLDGEIVATGDDGKPMPFQQILRRIRRKYDVEAAAEIIPLRLYLFDILYLNGETLVDMPLSERRRILEDAIKPLDGLTLSEQFLTSKIENVEMVYRSALAAGHEGVMLKNPASPYTPGQRGKNWLKWKREMETLDLAVVGAEWGEGKRAGVLGTYLLACRDLSTGDFLEIGRVATGFSDEELEQFTELFRPLFEYEEGVSVRIRPHVVFEVGYDELQKSPNYKSGYALRFPRLVRMRDDRDPRECDTLTRVEEMYDMQKG